MTKNNKTTQYYYNGLGQRFSKNGIVYMYDLAGHLIGEYTNTGALIQETVWLNNLPIATIRPSGTGISVYFVHADELGTPRVVTDTAQKPVWRWDGDAFGRGLPNQDPLKTGVKFVYHLRYPGQYYDTESGLHYNYFRDYDPETGRYIQSDPIGLAGGFNTYAYVGGGPLRLIDPLGLDILVIENGPTSGNPIGHTAMAVSPDFGVYSSGNNAPPGMALIDYLKREKNRRNTTLYLIKATPAQDAAALSVLKKNYQRIGIPQTKGNCSDKSNEALDAAGIPDTWMPNTWPGSAGDRAISTGAGSLTIFQSQ